MTLLGTQKILCTEALTATGQLADQASAEITGPGTIVGLDYLGAASGNTCVIRDDDDMGQVLYDTAVGATLTTHVDWTGGEHQYRNFRDGLHATITAGRLVVYYIPA